jgi:hypothetical protein
MFFQYGTDSKEQPTAAEESQLWGEQLETYLAPYSERLDAYLDRRVVGNLTATVAGIVQTRSELTTREWGRVICGPGAFCRALEERQPAQRRLGARAHSLGDGARQTELPIESLRLQDGESRRKMLLLVTLA